MKSVCLSVVRNEADVIEVFVRYHANIFDHVIVMEHHSKDGTADILDALVKEGLPLTILKSQAPYHAQGENMTFMLKETRQKYKPLVMMPLDADEFVVGDIKRAAYEFLSPMSTLAVTWRNYAPTQLNNPHVLRDITHRHSKINIAQHKPLIPGILFDYDVHVKEGCHEVYSSSAMVQLVMSNVIHLAHFPIRSSRQLTKKALVGWTAKLANPANNGLSPHWKMFFDKAKKGNEFSLTELQALSLGYSFDHSGEVAEMIDDPVPYKDIDIKYSIADNYDALEALADASEILASQLGRVYTA